MGNCGLTPNTATCLDPLLCCTASNDFHLPTPFFFLCIFLYYIYF
ncbi:unnamed protein product [Phytomonas sp. Hart1]|nr:unnamed protein product [Phytomonas sp. Hart1]|eukprot:CCW69370.1 unnamed protein product [Phytomonas sp. isolate Hart1]